MPATSADLYDDSPPPAAGGGDPPEKPDADPEDKDGKTSILPKSFFADGVKPGDKCDVEVTAVHDDSVEVQPCEGHDEEPDGGDQPAPAAAPEGSMSSMME